MATKGDEKVDVRRAREVVRLLSFNRNECNRLLVRAQETQLSRQLARVTDA